MDLLNDLIRKGWTVTVYYCGLGIPAVKAVREREEQRYENKSLTVAIERLHAQIHEQR